MPRLFSNFHILVLFPLATHAFMLTTTRVPVITKLGGSSSSSSSSSSFCLAAAANGGQQPKPRFLQQAHARKKKKSNAKRQPWESGKSIEELESTMMKRWGSLDGPRMSAGEEGTDLRRPVADPWDDGPENGKGGSAPIREYYDEDDEGFEFIEIEDGEEEDLDGYILEEDDDGDTPVMEGRRGTSQHQKMKISHLIAPKPAGGKGNRQLLDDTPSYFFNPDAAAAVPPPNDIVSSTSNNKHKTVDTGKSSPNTNAADTKENRPKRKVPTPAQVLLDEDGDPILMTVDEALYRFQQSVGDDAMLEVIDTAEVPIVACTNAESWQDLGIASPILLKNLEDMNCPTPLAVQEKSCPGIITGNDMLIGTYTGSGKTLAFLTPLVQRLLWNMDEDPGLAVVIVAPGRELASQIVSVARLLLEDTSLRVQLAIGGTTFSRNLEQIRKRKPNIIVGTPGRIAELIVGKPGEKSGKLKTGSLQALVMDEFDALLEYKPHRDPTRAFMHHLKRRHGDSLQSILCSATASDIMDTAKVVDFLRPGYATAMADEDDVLVTEVSSKAPQVSRTVLHGVVHVPHRRFALDTIRRLLHTEPVPQQILIFAENSRKVDIVVEKLENMGITAAALHGGMGSEKMDRAEVSKALREGFVGIVVATELAARGLDAPLLTHVINLDLPTDASHYAHRAGRCGRGGRPGVVINITTSPKERNVPKRFAGSLGIEMHSVEPRNGKLVMLDPETQQLD